MKKTVAILLALLLTATAAGCANDESSTFTHGVYEVAYQTELITTGDGNSAVKVIYPYYERDGKRMDASTLGSLFADGGICGMYLVVDGLAYPIGEVNINHADNKAEACSVVVVPNVSESSSIEVCYAGLDRFVERDGNRFYYAPYRLAELAENGSAQLLIDFSYVNGIQEVKKDDFVSGGCPNLIEPLSSAIAHEHFIVTVDGVDYEADSLSVRIAGTQSGGAIYARAQFIIEIPADTPIDAAVEVK